jgi:peptidoglycan/xylan/chitin deacetylase (PgdA/CDA1 family)
MSRRAFTLAAAALILAGCGEPDPRGPTGGVRDAVAVPPIGPSPSTPAAAPQVPGKDMIVATFSGQAPRSWGLQIPGAASRLPAGTQGTALTFDCCGGPGGSGVDHALIDTLQKTGTPATFFLNSRWIQANPGPAKSLAENPLFDIGNHGTRHVPLSVSGRSAYGIPGTASPAEVYDEIMVNQEALFRLTGRQARYFRPGTAYYDEISVAVVRKLGLIPVSFSINGDGGATFPAPVVFQEVGAAKAGDIIIAHANHPASGTAAGIARALTVLQTTGLKPGRLDVI